MKKLLALLVLLPLFANAQPAPPNFAPFWRTNAPSMSNAPSVVSLLGFVTTNMTSLTNGNWLTNLNASTAFGSGVIPQQFIPGVLSSNVASGNSVAVTTNANGVFTFNVSSNYFYMLTNLNATQINIAATNAFGGGTFNYLVGNGSGLTNVTAVALLPVPGPQVLVQTNLSQSTNVLVLSGFTNGWYPIVNFLPGTAMDPTAANVRFQWDGGIAYTNGNGWGVATEWLGGQPYPQLTNALHHTLVDAGFTTVDVVSLLNIAAPMSSGPLGTNWQDGYDVQYGTNAAPGRLSTNGFVQTLAVNESYGGVTNSLQSIREIVAHYQPAANKTTNFTLAADCYAVDDIFTGSIGLTNYTIYGLGHNLLSAITNTSAYWTASTVILSGISYLDGITVSNLYWPLDSTVQVDSIGVYNLSSNFTIVNSGFFGAPCGIAEPLLASGTLNISGTYSNDYFFGYSPGISENAFPLTIGGTNTSVINCTMVGAGKYNFSALTDWSSGHTNIVVGCKLFATNNTPYSGTFRTNIGIAFSSQPYSVGITNCQVYSGRDPGSPYFRTNVNSGGQPGAQGIWLASGGNNQCSVSFVGTFFSLQGGPGQTNAPLGEIEMFGGATQYGKLLFKDCVVWPNPGTNIIFYNNGQPVTIQGGNLTSANFSEPSVITVQ